MAFVELTAVAREQFCTSSINQHLISSSCTKWLILGFRGHIQRSSRILWPQTRNWWEIHSYRRSSLTGAWRCRLSCSINIRAWVQISSTQVKIRLWVCAPALCWRWTEMSRSQNLTGHPPQPKWQGLHSKFRDRLRLKEIRWKRILVILLLGPSWAYAQGIWAGMCTGTYMCSHHTYHTPYHTHTHTHREKGGRGREENNSMVTNQTGGPKKEFTSSNSTVVQRFHVT